MLAVLRCVRIPVSMLALALCLQQFAGAQAAVSDVASAADGQACSGTIYLTLDTGNMAEADRIAGILARHGVRATFFLANERTRRGDFALDESWAAWWRARVAEGHAFGSHTLDHVYFLGATTKTARGDRAGTIAMADVRPQFGPQAGRRLNWTAVEVCASIDRVDQRFRQMTGQGLDRLWRAPGGKLPHAVDQMASACGWSHVPWTAAGFLGDELPSERFPNDRLLARQLREIGDGDILLAHLGIWSRREPYAPTLDPLIEGLRSRGLCFATIPEHPRWRKQANAAQGGAGQ